MTQEQINDKACELAKKFFPDEENIWARENIEAAKVKLACLEMAKWLQEETAPIGCRYPNHRKEANND